MPIVIRTFTQSATGSIPKILQLAMRLLPFLSHTLKAPFIWWRLLCRTAAVSAVVLLLSSLGDGSRDCGRRRAGGCTQTVGRPVPRDGVANRHPGGPPSTGNVASE